MKYQKEHLEQIFQLTTSRRGRRRSLLHTNSLECHFNSRPHEEVDGMEDAEEIP